ncbi:TPA: hypothetical protein ACIVWC_004809, partial [Salmonella enterica subsp. diarizonae serovar 61:l,v:z35]
MLQSYPQQTKTIPYPDTAIINDLKNQKNTNIPSVMLQQYNCTEHNTKNKAKNTQKRLKKQKTWFNNKDKTLKV